MKNLLLMLCIGLYSTAVSAKTTIYTDTYAEASAAKKANHNAAIFIKDDAAKPAAKSTQEADEFSTFITDEQMKQLEAQELDNPFLDKLKPEEIVWDNVQSPIKPAKNE